MNGDCVDSGSLRISRAEKSDEGKYECVAENSAGVAYSYPANLGVHGTYIAVLYSNLCYTSRHTHTHTPF